MQQFKTKSGFLTRYALGCGYCEEHQNGPHRVSLWLEGPTLNVRYHADGIKQFWESFPVAHLGKARKLFVATKRLIDAKVAVDSMLQK